MSPILHDAAAYYASSALLSQMREDCQEGTLQLDELATEHLTVKSQMLFLRAITEASEQEGKETLLDLYTSWVTYIDKLRTLLTAQHVQEKLLYQLASEHTPEEY